MLSHSVIIGFAHLAVSAIALMATAYLLSGFEVGGFFSALVVAVVLGFANIFIKPILLFLTLPLNILTLGLFTFVVNGIVLRICAWILPNFTIRGWKVAMALC